MKRVIFLLAGILISCIVLSIFFLRREKFEKVKPIKKSRKQTKRSNIVKLKANDKSETVERIVKDKLQETLSRAPQIPGLLESVQRIVEQVSRVVLNPTPSTMRPSTRAQKILAENRKIINKNKNLKILVIGEDRYIYDKQSNQLIDIQVVEKFDFFEAAKEIGTGLAKGVTEGDWTFKATYVRGQTSVPISCFGQEGLNPLCPAPTKEIPRRDIPYTVNPVDPSERDPKGKGSDIWPGGYYYDEEREGIFKEGKLWDEEVTWNELLYDIRELNREAEEKYLREVDEYNNLPDMGYCCYSSSAQEGATGTCSTSPCKSATDEILGIIPGIMAGLGVSLIIAGKAALTAVMAALLVKIGLILLIIAAVLLLLWLLWGFIGGLSGKNKEGAKKGYEQAKDIINNGIPNPQLEESQNGITVIESFNDNETDNVVIDLNSPVDSSVASGTNLGDGYISFGSGIGGYIPENLRSEFIDKVISTPPQSDTVCSNIDCRAEYDPSDHNDHYKILKMLRCCDPTIRRELIPVLPEPESPQQDAGRSDELIPDISPVVHRYCNNDYEVIIQEDGTRTTRPAGNICCSAICVDGQWTKICGTPEEYLDVPGEIWDPTYMSSVPLGIPCSDPRPCFYRDGGQYDCDNPPTDDSSGGRGSGGSDDVPTLRA